MSDQPEQVGVWWRNEDTGEQVNIGTAEVTHDEHGIHYTARLDGRPAAEAGQDFTMSWGYHTDPDPQPWVSPTTGSRIHSYGPVLSGSDEPDPDIIRGIERVTGERYDWATGEWITRQPVPCPECGRNPCVTTCPAQDD